MTGRWLHGLVALLLLALASGQPAAVAVPMPASPQTDQVASPCHAHGAADAAAGKAERKAPACCPDGCPGHCLVAAALPPVPPRLPPAPAPAEATAWAPGPLPSLAANPAEQPPRA
jgi:hypothetical protein